MSKNYEAIRTEINEALEKIGQKYGFTAELGSIRYNEAGFQTSITAKVNETIYGKSGAQLEYEMYARKFDIDPSSFGRSFYCKGEKYTITGINPKARTMPILAKDDFGKSYKFTVAATGFRSFNFKDIK